MVDPQTSSDSTPSMGEYLAALRRRRMLMLVIGTPIVLIAGILALALPDVYRSNAYFRLVTDRLAEAVAESSELADQYVYSLADRVWDSEKIKEVVREVDPYPELGDDESAARSELLDNVSIQMTIQEVLQPGAGRETSVNTGFVVSYENRSPAKARAVTKGLANVFIDLSRAERLKTADNKIRFYTGEADRTRTEIADYERQLAIFKEKNFQQLPETAQANITIRARLETELENVDREIRGIQQNRVFIVQQLRQAQAGPAVSNLSQMEAEYARISAIYAENHPDVVTLRRQIESLRATGPASGGSTLQGQLDTQKAALAEARQRYSEDHPDIKRMMRNIESLEARIASGESPTASLAGESLMAVQLQTQVNALDTQLAGLQGRSAQLRQRLEELESRLGSTPEVEREYQAISRGLTTARAQFEQMVGSRLNSQMEAAAIQGGTADRFELIASPNLPREPARPQRLAIVILGLIVAAIAALSAVVVAELLDQRVRGAADIRRTLGRAPLAVVPEIQNSVYWRTRTRRVARLTASILILTPILYLFVHLLVA